MLQQIAGFITIHDVAREMGLELTDQQAWAAGKLLQKLYRFIVKVDPLKDNRRKKSGMGSHCFALYPNDPAWRERIERALRTVRAQEAAQLDLFAGMEAAL